MSRLPAWIPLPGRFGYFWRRVHPLDTWPGSTQIWRLMSTDRSTGPAATGVAGLDDILRGGYPRGRVLLIEGDPGVGKTTLALQFLMEGARRGERGVYVTLSETKEELRAVAASHGWTLDGIEVFELAPPDVSSGDQNTLFHPSEVELAE